MKDLGLVKWLVEVCGVSPEATSDKNIFSQPIHLACCNGSLSFVRWLVDIKHIKFDTADNDGSTPLDYAIHGGHLDIAKILVDKAAQSSCWLDPFSLLSAHKNGLRLESFGSFGGRDEEARREKSAPCFEYLKAVQTANQMADMLIQQDFGAGSGEWQR